MIIMTGIGIPINQSNNPRPNPTTISIRFLCPMDVPYVRWTLCPIENAETVARFLWNIASVVCCSATLALAPIARDETSWPEAVPGNRLHQLVAIKPGS
jgi:hypothetical protein